MSQSAALQLLAKEVRPKTIRLLEAATDAELLWAPPGTSNHILWHAGHALWVGDVLCLEPIMSRSMLPEGWAETFGQDCRPVAQTRDWPQRSLLLKLLQDQLKLMIEQLGTLSDERLNQPVSPTVARTLAYAITHGLHDEANHQGEMYLLLKMQRKRP